MQWEYTTVEFNNTSFWGGVTFNGEEINEQTNQLGAQGWELVSAIALNEGAGRSKSIVLFSNAPAPGKNL